VASHVVLGLGLRHVPAPGVKPALALQGRPHFSFGTPNVTCRSRSERRRLPDSSAVVPSSLAQACAGLVVALCDGGGEACARGPPGRRMILRAATPWPSATRNHPGTRVPGPFRDVASRFT
jgi:hypothetical protein